MEPDGSGHHTALVDDVAPGSRYFYRLADGRERGDPASRSQPEGVHGPSEVIDPDFPWKDRHWFGLPLRDYVIYELHVGTFTPEGTFDAAIPRLPDLADLGVTAVELMPVAQFPGERNWGYDGVFPFSPQNSYGGPEGLRRFVDACHRQGLAVILDVVYNHLGPEGNYLSDFGPYFTDRYKTPWGSALNFDGPDSDPVRRFFIENALCWITEFHVDALRLDAVHAILDHSPFTFLEQLAGEVHDRAKSLNRQIFLFPESAANDARLIRSPELGGYGMDAQWNDDFHHALRGVLTGERTGYYEDYGEFRHLVKSFRDGFVYSGEFSKYRRRRHGTSARDIPAERFVVFSQNHDQVGNRMLGERLTALISFEGLKLAAGAVLFSPFLPLLFMGEEYGEKAPFQYFVSHSDPDLVEAVRKGRSEEFAAFGWRGEVPDPQDEATFMRSKLDHRLCEVKPHSTLRAFYQELIRLRKSHPSLAHPSKERLEVSGYDSDRILAVRRADREAAEEALLVFHFGDASLSRKIPLPAGDWRKRLDSAEKRWQGPGAAAPETLSGDVALRLPPLSFVLYSSET
jgi:maltooligosyltrehalose trehalohydrolase